MDFFKGIYSEDNTNWPPLPIHGYFPKINESQLQHLTQQVSNKEIKMAFFDLKSMKAPGQMDFNMFFSKPVRPHWFKLVQFYKNYISRYGQFI